MAETSHRKVDEPKRTRQTGSDISHTALDPLAHLRELSDAVSEHLILFADSLHGAILAELHHSAGYRTIKDFSRSEFPRMSAKTIATYLQVGRYLYDEKIPLKDAMRRGFERILLEAHAYFAVQHPPDPRAALEELHIRALSSRELRWIARRPAAPRGDSDVASTQAMLARLVGKTITTFRYAAHSVRVATADDEAVVYTPSGKGRLVVRVLPTSEERR